MNKKRLTAYLLLYNFIGYTVAVGGWLWEVLIFLVTEQRFVNRGFFHGPYLPVYGAGAVLLSVLFYQKRIAVIVTYAHLNQTDYPQDFYHSRLYARLRGLIYLIRRKRFEWRGICYFFLLSVSEFAWYVNIFLNCQAFIAWLN